MQLFKVLTADARPMMGASDFKYDLPADGKPGKWTRAVKPVPCESGYHLTARPEAWYQSGARIFLADYRGAIVIESDKVACESVRLVEEITPDWALLRMFPVLRLLLVVSWRRANPSAEIPSWADLSGANLYGANLSDANLSGAHLSRANLYGANLFRANLSDADLSGADLSGANLPRAYLSGANLSGADLSGANLSGANLSGAYLSGANLYGANLSGANLYGANLSDANLSDADLSGANLSGANLSGANLSRANLFRANLSRATGYTLPAAYKLNEAGVAVRKA